LSNHFLEDENQEKGKYFKFWICVDKKNIIVETKYLVWKQWNKYHSQSRRAAKLNIFFDIFLYKLHNLTFINSHMNYINYKFYQKISQFLKILLNKSIKMIKQIILIKMSLLKLKYIKISSIFININNISMDRKEGIIHLGGSKSPIRKTTTNSSSNFYHN
jgi:hypothetical protein